MATPFDVGEIFQDRYEILHKLSAGGFGEVYKARQLATGQLVAIKCLLERNPDKRDKHVARFQREMKICAELHHPNIVRLIDSGQTRHGDLFSVFEFIPGRNLAQVLSEEKRLSPVEAGRMMAQVLDALSCAHELGIVHRDLKPGNIMIMSTGARRNALVLDFGIGAFIADGRRADEEPLTSTFERLGTPGYAAPEQLRGEPPTPQSDLYAWGLVLLECLTGERAIPGAAPLEIVHNQMSPEPIPIPAFLHGHELGAILRAVTAKDPTHRQVTARGLLRQLESCDISALDERLPPLSYFDVSPTLSYHPVTPASGELSVRRTPRSEDNLSGERRQVTAMSCSVTLVVGGEARLDLEEHDTLLQSEQQVCAALAQRFGGYQAAVIGNQTMFYFGYPRARDDDARRAATAALAIVKGMSERSAALERRHALRVAVRIGIHTGLVVTKDTSESVTRAQVLGGSTPSIAQGMEAVAPWGEIVVSRSTHGLLRSSFRFGEPSSRAIAGAPGPLEVYPLHGAVEEPSILRSSAGDSGEIVGRAEELALLRHRWDTSCRGTGQVALISGEAGIGKSRLARELGSLVRGQPHHWLEGRCMPDSQNSVLRPIVELIEHFLGFEAELSPDEKRARLDQLFERFRLPINELMPLLGPLLGLPADVRFTAPDISPQRYKELTLNALLSLLVEMAADKPVLLILEDLHWADPTTIELLSLLLEEAPSSAICTILTARPQFTPPWRSAELTQIRLGRLEPEGVEVMLTRLAGGRPLPAPVTAAIVQRTDGIPLFVEELTRTILESGAIALHGDAYKLVGSLDDLAIPATLRDSLMARLDRLGAARATAQLAATIGREFTRALLAAVSPLDAEALTAALNRLVSAELVFRRRRLGGEAYMFKHALIRDIAYESLLKPARRQYHEHIAERLVDGFPDIAASRPDLVAYHFAAAERILEAAEYSRQAGQQALSRSANAEAVSHSRQAIQWLQRNEPSARRAVLELELNGILMSALLYIRGMAAPEVAEVIGRSQELVDEIGDSPAVLPSLWAMYMYHVTRAHYDTAVALAQRILALGERLGDTLAPIAGYYMLGIARLMLGTFEQSVADLEHAVALYDADRRGHLEVLGQDIRSMSLAMMSLSLWMLGYPDRALSRAEESVAWAQHINHLNSRGSAMIYLAGVAQYRDEPGRARLVVDELNELMQAHHMPQWAALSALVQSWVEHDVASGRSTLQGLEAFGQALALPYWGATVADSEAAVGQLDEAIARLDECLAIAAQNGEPYYVAEIYRRKGMYILRRDRTAYDHAEACFRAALDEARGRNARMPELLSLACLCRLGLERGRRDQDAEHSLRACYDWFTEGFDTPALRQARALLDELAA